MLNFYNFHNKKLDRHDQLFDEIQIWNHKKYGYPFQYLPNIIKRIPRDACIYVDTNIKGRWIEAEPIIMRNSYYAYRYARYTLKCRWPEAEPHILMSPWNSCEYAIYVIKGRWPEAEPIIMMKTNFACKYAEHVLKERWIEAEPYMDKDDMTYSFYKDVFNIC